MMAVLLDTQQLPAYAPAVGCACARIMVSWVMRAAVAFAVLLALASPPVRAQVALYDSLLHEAAATGDIELTRYLLDGGAAVDARAALDGVTPLHSAARSGEAEVARLLLARGAAVGARAVGYHTPLHMATARWPSCCWPTAPRSKRSQAAARPCTWLPWKATRRGPSCCWPTVPR